MDANVLIPPPVDTNVSFSPHYFEDLRLLAKWVREDLFDQVKFLPQGKKDLELQSAIHRKFVKKCKDTLPGVKANGRNILARAHYADRLWEAAIGKKNIISNALALRRSGVYTVMQNRFEGVCVVLLSWHLVAGLY
jgi:hypothetical protein